jgi:hypothetical protein
MTIPKERGRGNLKQGGLLSLFLIREMTPLLGVVLTN